ncbi:MAG: putative Ig domain-containing protein, partial [Thermoplasmata archaeon]|nr:putative Ig domain-containing protein [Thermoplasmata archaeon]
MAIPSGNLVEPAEAVVTRAFAGGDGSIEDPYQISDVDQLQDMSSNLSAYYVLINDIDASATVGWNSGEGFIPIGTMTPLTDWFVGSLDGQGYNITDLFINRATTDFVGLFGVIGDATSLSDIGLIDNNVSGKNMVGGLVGESVGTISNCYATGSVSGADYVGGLVARASRPISDCYATGSVSGYDVVGGLVGSSDLLSNCYATGNVSGRSEIGGLAGDNWDDVSDCYATGSVSGDNTVGGLVGFTWDDVSDCYATGSVSGGSSVGGLVGVKGGLISNCFWDVETSGMATSDGGTGKTTAEMKNKSTFTSAGWDLTSVWGILNGSSYPFLQNYYRNPLIFFSNETVVDIEEDSYFTAAFEYEISSYPCENTFQSKSLDTNASWLTWDAMNNTIYGTPTNDDIGPYWANLTVIDMIGSTVKAIMLTVVNVNDAPEIITSDDTSCFQDLLYVKNYTANDVDPTDDTFTWSLNTSAVWLAINSTTGALSGTPTNDDVGTFWVNVTVSDGNGGEDYTNFTLNVININDAPVITTSNITTAIEDMFYSVDYNATDMDPTFDTLTWNLSTDAGWLTIDPSLGWLNGTPTNDDVGTFWVQVEVDDGNNGSDVHEFTIVVSNTNDAPIWSLAPEDRNMTEGDVLFLDCLATDVDGD